MSKLTVFDDDKAFSESEENDRGIRIALMRKFPYCLGITKAHNKNDRLGADYILEFAHCQFRTVDVKTRRDDWTDRDEKKQVAIIEIVSNTKTSAKGWSVDPEKITDWIMYFYPTTGRAWFYPADQLRAGVTANLDSLRSRGKPIAGQGTGNYTSDAFLVSHRDLWTAMYKHAEEIELPPPV